MHLLTIAQMWTDHVMDGWGWGMAFFWWLIGIAVIVLVVVAVMRLSRGGRGKSGESALEILERRYARGEIDKDEYDRLRRDLE